MPTTIHTTPAPAIRTRERYAEHHYEVRGVAFPRGSIDPSSRPQPRVDLEAVARWVPGDPDYCSLSLTFPTEITPSVEMTPRFFDGETVEDPVVHFRGFTREALRAWRDILSQMLADMGDPDALTPEV
jgi:hypothetical protein